MEEKRQRFHERETAGVIVVTAIFWATPSEKGVRQNEWKETYFQLMQRKAQRRKRKSAFGSLFYHIDTVAPLQYELFLCSRLGQETAWSSLSAALWFWNRVHWANLECQNDTNKHGVSSKADSLVVSEPVNKQTQRVKKVWLNRAQSWVINARLSKGGKKKIYFICSSKVVPTGPADNSIDLWQPIVLLLAIEVNPNEKHCTKSYWSHLITSRGKTK